MTANKPKSGQRCRAAVFHADRRIGDKVHACDRIAKITRNGKAYCGIHDPERPDRVKRRKADALYEKGVLVIHHKNNIALRFHDRLVELVRTAPEAFSGQMSADVMHAEWMRFQRAVLAELEKEQGR